jgi:hypothetical protein
MNKSVHIGSPIVELSSTGYGVIGAFARSSSEDIYALTSASALNADRDSIRALAARTDPNLIASVKLGRNVAVSMTTSGGVRIRGLADPRLSLGQRVRTALPSFSAVGTVSAYRSRSLLTHAGSGAEIRGLGLLEIRFDGVMEGGDWRALVTSSIAGALIVDDQDEAVGLLVAKSDSLCYAAPLMPYLEDMGLQFGAPLAETDVSDEISFVEPEVREGLKVLVDGLHHEESLDLEAA